MGEANRGSSAPGRRDLPASGFIPGGGRRRHLPGEKPKDMRSSVLRLIRLTRGRRRGLGWVMLFSALTCLSSVLSPLVIGRAVSAIDAGDEVRASLLVLAAVYAGDALVRLLQGWLIAGVGQRMIHWIRMDLFDAMKALPLRFHDAHRHGELMSRMTNDIDAISTTFSDSLAQLLTYLFTIAGILAIMAYMNSLLTAVALCGALVVVLFTRYITTHTRKLYAAQQRHLGALNAQIEESVSGLTVVKAFGREQACVERFEASNPEYQRAASRAGIFSGYLMPVTNVINNLTYVVLAVVSGVLAVRGGIGVGMITSFLLYSRQFSRPFVEISSIYNGFQSAVAGAERVFEVLDAEPEPPDRPDALPLENPRGDIAFDHVSFGYAPGQTVLRDVCLNIPAGTRVAVAGATGSGKTTLINLLTRFYDVDEGRILLDGHDLRNYRMADLRSAFGVVLQDTALFNLSIGDNIRYGRPGAAPQEVRAAAELAGAAPFIERLPRGYETELTMSGAELSQGERQLLTIARAVLMNAPILILDEATSSVDTVTEQNIRRAMLQITHGRTSVIIAHRLSTIRDSDVIVLLEDGRIVEQGSHEALMRLNGRYADMYRKQMGL